MNENVNKTPNMDNKNNPGIDQEFSVLIQSAVDSALSSDSISVPNKEAFKKLLAQVPTVSPYQGAIEPTRSNFKRVNRMYSSVVHAWKVTIPVVALVLAVSGGVYYYQIIPVSSGPFGSVSSNLVAVKGTEENSNTSDLMTNIESLISSELELELEDTNLDTAEDIAMVTSDSFEAKNFATVGDIESLQ